MDPPISFAADSVRDEQTKILQAIQPLSSEDVSQLRCIASSQTSWCFILRRMTEFL